MTKTTRSSSRLTPAKPTKTSIVKKSKSADKTVTKKGAVTKAVATKKATKKDAVAPKATAKVTKQAKRASSTKGNSNILELCLLLDCTGSMGSWIQRSKDTLKEIIHSVKKENEALTVRVCFIGYRDVQDKPRFEIFQFSEDLDAAVKFITSMRAMGGGDAPEDVQGGLNHALKMPWTEGSIKQLFLICDAPGHGKDICDGHDNHSKGSPDGHRIQNQMQEFAKKRINFNIVRVNSSVDKMIGVMRANFDSLERKIIVTDLQNSVSTKTHAEVTKEFVAATSYILSVAVGGAAHKKVAKKVSTDPLWDTKKFEVGQWFSQNAYFIVKEISGTRITVENSFGETMHVSKDIIEKMDSGNHFAKEVPVNMTELAELLESVGDTVFTVSFRKQVKEEDVQDKLKSFSPAQLKDAKQLNALVKELIEGEECTMTCHLVKAETSLGRSTVIDLTSKHENKFRQVDHRTINYIIYHNVKYVLKKGGKKRSKEEESDEEMDESKKKKEEPKWNSAELAVGNVFSGTSYYRATAVSGDNVVTRCQGQDITVSRSILETQMYNASVFSKEEKLCLTKVAKVLEEANTACFTVCFNAKVDEKVVKEKLQGLNPADLKNKSKVAEIAKDIMHGKETVLVGRLSKAMGKLGRSLIIDLPTQGYRQVDHRTLKWLIIKNVKYVVSK